MQQFKNILIIRLGGIGDIAFTLPAVNLVKKYYPNCHLTFLTYKEFEPLLHGFPAINEIITIDRRLYLQKKLKAIKNDIAHLFKHLHEKKYELVIDFQAFGETAVISWLSRAKCRLGFSPDIIQKLFYTFSIEEFSKKHRIDKNCELLEKYGMPQTQIVNDFVLPDIELAQAQALFNELGLNPSKPLIFIQPFTNRPKKNWPLENYLAFAEYWEQQGFQIIFGGGPADRKKLTSVSDKFPVTAGKASLLTNIGLMKMSTLIVGGDTGLLHFGVAVGKKILMLMGPTNPKTYGPYGHPEWAIRLDSRCIIDIQIDQAIKLSEELLSSNS
jgi:ADP-heptose:LPS heptosyltransferase